MPVFWDIADSISTLDIIQYDEWIEPSHIEALIEQRAMVDRFIRVPTFVLLF